MLNSSLHLLQAELGLKYILLRGRTWASLGLGSACGAPELAQASSWVFPPRQFLLLQQGGDSSLIVTKQSHCTLNNFAFCADLLLQHKYILLHHDYSWNTCCPGLKCSPLFFPFYCHRISIALQGVPRLIISHTLTFSLKTKIRTTYINNLPPFYFYF